jgi:hypothetical protein
MGYMQPEAACNRKTTLSKMFLECKTSVYWPYMAWMALALEAETAIKNCIGTRSS